MKQCTVCGADFEPKSKKGVYCSAKCKQKDYRKGMAELLKIARNMADDKFIKESNAVSDILNGGTTTKGIENTVKPTRLKGESGMDYSIRLAEWREQSSKG